MPSEWLRQLPIVVDSGRLRINLMQKCYIPEVYNLIQFIGNKALGMNTAEFGTEGHFSQFMRSVIKEKLAFVAEEVDTDLLAGCVYWYPCLFARSVSPPTLGGYAMIHPRYAGRKLGSSFIKVSLARMVETGYLAEVSRAAVENPAGYLCTVRNGSHVTGSIPLSFSSPTKGWTDDLIQMFDFRSYLPKDNFFLNMTEQQLMTHAMKATKPVHPMPLLRLPSLHLQVSLSSGHTISLQSSSEEGDLRKVFDIIKQAASDGDSFSLDEAPTLDIFYNRYLNGKHLVIIKSDHNIVGFAFLGKSHLTRSVDSPSGLLYLYITPKFRRQGYGSVVFPHLEAHVMQCGYSGALVDLFAVPGLPNCFMKRQGYTLVGNVALSGFMRGQGWVDALIFYKSFKGAEMLSHLNRSEI